MAVVYVHSELLEAGEHKLVTDGQWKDALRQLKRHPVGGKHLAAPLRGCQSIRVGGENRLIYRCRTPECAEVEVLAIGRRRDSAAYRVAAKRI